MKFIISILSILLFIGKSFCMDENSLSAFEKLKSSPQLVYQGNLLENILIPKTLNSSNTKNTTFFTIARYFSYYQNYVGNEIFTANCNRHNIVENLINSTNRYQKSLDKNKKQYLDLIRKQRLRIGRQETNNAIYSMILSNKFKDYQNIIEHYLQRYILYSKIDFLSSNIDIIISCLDNNVPVVFECGDIILLCLGYYNYDHEIKLLVINMGQVYSEKYSPTIRAINTIKEMLLSTSDIQHRKFLEDDLKRLENALGTGKGENIYYVSTDFIFYLKNGKGKNFIKTLNSQDVAMYKMVVLYPPKVDKLKFKKEILNKSMWN